MRESMAGLVVVDGGAWKLLEAMVILTGRLWIGFTGNSRRESWRTRYRSRIRLKGIPSVKLDQYRFVGNSG